MTPPMPNLYPRVDAARVEELRPGIWLALWGLLIVIVDISVFGDWVELDLVHDSAGYLLILSSLGHLRRASRSERSRRYIRPIAIVALVGIPVSLLDIVLEWEAGLLAAIDALFELAGTLAIVGYLWTLAAVYREALERSLERVWLRAAAGAALLWLVPGAIGTVVGLAMLAGGEEPVTIRLHSGEAACVMGLVMLTPLALMLYAVSKAVRWTPPGPLTHCHVCGYAVARLPSPRCPECGTLFATERGSVRPGDMPEARA